jgi:hypothetical protein
LIHTLCGKLGAVQVRQKPNGKFAPWFFRFSAFDEEDGAREIVSCRGDTSLSGKEYNKTILPEQININDRLNVFQTGWAALIKAAKTSW